MPVLSGIHGLRPAQDHAVVDAVLDVRGPVGDAEDALRVGLVLREQEGHITVAVQVELAEFGVRRGHDHAGRGAIRLPEQRPVAARPPGPQVAEPERRQDVEFGRVGPAIVGRELDEDVLRRFLGILDEHVEVAVLVEDTGIEQLILELAPPAALLPHLHPLLRAEVLLFCACLPEAKAIELIEHLADRNGSGPPRSTG